MDECPAKDGYSVGIDVVPSPPSCVYCSDAEFKLFDPETAECVCAPGRI